jgi:ATP-dependent Clp protease adaptor protein ClpS
MKQSGLQVVLSPELERLLSDAVAEAVQRSHPLVRLVHLVHAMAADPSSASVLSACGAKVGKLRAKLGRRLDHLPNFDPLPASDGVTLPRAVELQRALQRAELQAHSAGRTQITVPGFLAALMCEETTSVVASLKRQGVTRLSVTIYDSHGTWQDAATSALPQARLLGRWRPTSHNPLDRYEVVFHNDDYTAREFVLELLTTLFARSRDEAAAVAQEVHARGTGSAGSYPLEEAQRLVERATRAARRKDFPLRLSVVRAT